MIAPALPHDEQERLHDLRTLGLLDSAPEDRFDRITRLATQAFGMPLAHIGFVDADRQWFKSQAVNSGCTNPWPNESAPRDASFCGHTILQESALIVPDTLEDERFKDNPAVTGDANIRFYAGLPLKGPLGHNVATFCLMDTEPRELSEQQLAAFEEMAGLAQRELSLVNIIEIQNRLIAMQDELKRTQKKLAHELAGAASYVAQLIPAPIKDEHVHIDWRFISSSNVGGDLMGYHWLDDDRLAIYLLDVSGHGVDASLHSASVYQSLRAQSLPVMDWANPVAVLSALNAAFPMDRNAGKFVTVWYSVYSKSNQTLRYVTAGHHPALLFPPGTSRSRALGQPSFMIGVTDQPGYTLMQTRIDPGSRLYIFSDAAFEVRDHNEPHDLLGFEGLQHRMGDLDSPTDNRLDAILGSIRAYQGQDTFGDDFSMMEIVFPGAA